MYYVPRTSMRRCVDQLWSITYDVRVHEYIVRVHSTRYLYIVHRSASSTVYLCMVELPCTRTLYYVHSTRYIVPLVVPCTYRIVELGLLCTRSLYIQVVHRTRQGRAIVPHIVLVHCLLLIYFCTMYLVPCTSYIVELLVRCTCTLYK